MLLFEYFAKIEDLMFSIPLNTEVKTTLSTSDILLDLRYDGKTGRQNGCLWSNL